MKKRKLFHNLIRISLVLCLLSTVATAQTNSTSTKGLTVENGQTTGETLAKIQTFFKNNAESQSLEPNDIENWKVTDDFTSRGIRHIHIVQSIGGIEIENATANFSLDENDNVLFLASKFISGVSSQYRGNLSPGIGAKEAIRSSAMYLDLNGQFGRELQSDESNQFKFAKGNLSLEDIDVKLILFHTGEQLVLAWKVSIYELDAEHWWQVYIDATTGSELSRGDWVVHCFNHSEEHHLSRSGHRFVPLMMPPPPETDQYNVFAFPIESPNHGERSIEIGPFLSAASPFGWHDTDGASGEEYTITRGNNVFAYEDTNDDNAPGFSPDGGANLNFDFPLNLNQNATGYQDAAITNLFYACNRIHDILYQYGFDESSGNFQTNNYGNGGAQNDEVYAEAQDGGGTNNANFATPGDGANPRMQMYLWTGSSGLTDVLTVNSPSPISGTYFASGAAFGPGLPSTPLTADLVLVEDGTPPEENDGCETPTNGVAISGKIAVLYRGNCNFTIKVANAQNAGAVAAIVINNEPGSPISMGGTDPNIFIPSIMISDVDGALIVDQLLTEPVNATISGNEGNYDRDGDFDNGIIIHEYGHGLSNRLTGGPSNSSCLFNAEQMGEGWSDFLTCMLTIDMNADNPVNRPIGTFAIGEPTNGTGIRPAPYDTSFAVNSYTYADVADVNSISQPHGIGFVWATMLWDLNWAFIDQYGYDPNLETGSGGNIKTLDLVIEAMKLQTCSPGFVDGRDAILQADQLLNGGENKCMIWRVFAKRGLGYSASQGSSDNRSDQVEAFDLPTECDVAVVAPSANFQASTNETCSGEVQFEDLSVDVPQSWLWDFGDGTTSTLQNPYHTYTTSGLYSVSLEVSNTIGSNILMQSDFIEVLIPDPPAVQDGNGCSSDSILLSASGSNTIYWTDLEGNVLDTGDVYYTEPADQSSSYYAVNVIETPHSYVGPVDNAFGTGGNHSTAFVGAINFTAETALTIHSAWVVSGATGIREIALWEGHNTTGAPIQVINVDIPFTGPGRIDLGFEIETPGEYSFGLDFADLYRNDAGADYPYVIPGLISLDGSPATAGNFYYYFYDIEVSEKSCTSDPVLVSANVVKSDFSTSISGLSVNFTDLSVGATSWAWDFGDVTTSTDQNPTHAYSQSGEYEVVLTINDECAISYTITVEDSETGIIDLGSMEVSMFPNPASEEVTLVFSAELTTNGRVQLFSIEGKLLKEVVIGKGMGKVVISVAEIQPQLTYLKLLVGSSELTQKLIVN